MSISPSGHPTSTPTLLLLPLFRRIALRSPRMYRRYLFFKGAVHQSMSGQCRLLRELRRNYDRFEHLTAAAFTSSATGWSSKGWALAYLRGRLCRHVTLPASLSAMRQGCPASLLSRPGFVQLRCLFLHSCCPICLRYMYTSVVSST